MFYKEIYLHLLNKTYGKCETTNFDGLNLHEYWELEKNVFLRIIYYVSTFDCATGNIRSTSEHKTAHFRSSTPPSGYSLRNRFHIGTFFGMEHIPVG